MSFFDLLGPLFGQLLGLSPLLLVWTAGALLAVASWERNPKVAGLVLAAMVLQFVTAVAGSLLTIWVPMHFREHGGNAQLGVIYSVIGGVRSVLSATAWGLMLAAVFASRKPTRPPSEVGEEPVRQVF
jgi:hypothetical protein